MLIDKSELLKAYDETHNGPPGKARELIEEAPGVEAVPLDKLCEWLDEYMTAPGVDVYEVPKNHQRNRMAWKTWLAEKMDKAWMEGLDAEVH